jgi:hypothetical protein
MNWSSLLKGACLTMTLSCFGLPQANALEISGGSSAVANLNDGMISKVVVVRRGGAVHGGVYRGPHGGVYRHGGAYRGGVYRGGVYRGGVYGAHPGYRYGGWARPGWYGWGPGGAIAAGAAIGVIGAAAAVAYAGQPPAPGLCWYYTDPSRRAGFWDACQ